MFCTEAITRPDRREASRGLFATAELLVNYRAMLSIARTMPSQDVRPSVRLSVTRRYSVETVIDIFKVFFTVG